MNRETATVLAQDETTQGLIGGPFSWRKGKRVEAAKALGEQVRPGAVMALMAALTDKDDDVRDAVAESLGRLGDPFAFDELCELVTSGDMAAGAAIRALGNPGDERASPFYLMTGITDCTN